MADVLVYLARTLQNTVPKLKTVIQLSGAAVTLAVFFLIGTFAPGNLPAQICGSITGISLIVFTLAFNTLDRIPSNRRTTVIIYLFTAFLVVTVISLCLTINEGDIRT
jgi:putative effector of murein hydrolase LrgA (UPF0299 family)